MALSQSAIHWRYLTIVSPLARTSRNSSFIESRWPLILVAWVVCGVCVLLLVVVITHDFYKHEFLEGPNQLRYNLRNCQSCSILKGI